VGDLTKVVGISGFIYSFEPIINHNSRVLVLGTIPGPESLSLRQYYAHPGNLFWRIIYGIFDEDARGATYEDKLRFLLDREIALWDMFFSAERAGALDADIRNGTPNDIPGLIQKYPSIKRVLLAGRKAEKSFKKLFPCIAVESFYVPSTSPAYAGKAFEGKLKEWKDALSDTLGYSYASRI